MKTTKYKSRKNAKRAIPNARRNPRGVYVAHRQPQGVQRVEPAPMFGLSQYVGLALAALSRPFRRGNR